MSTYESSAFCGRCGRSVGVNIKFCGSCGASVEPVVALARIGATSRARPSVITSVAQPTPRSPKKALGSLMSPKRHPRVILPVAGALALVLGVTTFATVLWLRERPAHRALESAQASFAVVTRDVMDAGTIGDLNEVGVSAQSARGDLANERRTLANRGDALSQAALGVLAAQDAHLAALAGLADLEAESLITWGEISSALGRSTSQLEEAVAVLTKVDSDAGERVEVDDAERVHITSVVGEFSSEILVQLTDDLLTRLLDARRTSGLRTTADLADDARAVVDAAKTGFDEGSEQFASVTAIGDALEAMGAMSTIDADHLARWSQVRGRLTAAVKAVPELANIGTAAVNGTNRLVREATRTMGTWRAEYAQAVRSRNAELESLSSYSDSVHANLAAYGGLRRQLSAFVGDVEADGTPYEDAVTYLDDALAARGRVRDALAASVAPAGLGIDVTQLVSLTDRAIVVIDDVRQDFAANSPCIYCYSYDIDSWDDLHLESESITAQLGPAQQAWESAVSSARASIQRREMPVKPNV